MLRIRKKWCKQGRYEERKPENPPKPLSLSYAILFPLAITSVKKNTSYLPDFIIIHAHIHTRTHTF